MSGDPEEALALQAGSVKRVDHGDCWRFLTAGVENTRHRDIWPVRALRLEALADALFKFLDQRCESRKPP